jgi:hypothetical protein
MPASAEPVPGNQRISTVVDVLSKSLAALAIALYGSGFLIVSISHSRYGFTETNPFRPKILAAGVWFFVLAGIPVASVAGLRRGRLPWIRFLRFLYPYYMGCWVLSFPAILLFNRFSPYDKAPPSWWELIVVVAVTGLLIFLSLSARVPSILAAPASILMASFFIYYTIHQLSALHFEESVVALWFFAIGVLTQLNLNIRSWKFTLFSILLALLIFAKLYYPLMKSSVGGGFPVDIVMYFNKDSAIKPNQSASLRLIEESDAGFYVIAQGERRAIFVPRNSVSLVYFSDNPTESKLLN